MRKIDIHHHLVGERGYIDRLLRAMDKAEIGKAGLIGLGPLFRGLFVRESPDGTAPDNEAVQAAVRAHPDRFFGWGFFRLGVNPAELVDEFRERGFAGLKFIIPRFSYGDERAFPVYARAEALGLPCLFHTGIVALPAPAPGEGVSSSHMACLSLERVAQEFPKLTIIIAHLGVQDALTALTLIRIFPNIHADLSGSIPGWRANFSPADWKRLLWFESASRKLLFGSDVHAAEIGESIRIYNGIAEAAGWLAAERADLYAGNAQRLLGCV